MMDVELERHRQHSEVLRGSVADVAGQLAGKDRIRGEFTLVLAPQDNSAATEEARLALAAEAVR